MRKRKSIYKSAAAQKELDNLYGRQMKKLGLPFRDRYLDTPFGRTHITETGNFDGKPLLVFHGGNANSAYNLLACRFLAEDFHLYAVDTIGHPGKSAETCLPARGNAYGDWAASVIDGLGYRRMACLGGSFGGGILMKLLCVAPEKVERAALLVPAGIQNAAAVRSVSMLFPMLFYRLTHQEKWLLRCILKMAIREEEIDGDSYEMIKASIDGVRVKIGMPGNVKPDTRCAAPALVMAAQKDCLFPAQKVLPQAKKIFRNRTLYVLAGRGHLHHLRDWEEKMIRNFLLRPDGLVDGEERSYSVISCIQNQKTSFWIWYSSELYLDGLLTDCGRILSFSSPSQAEAYLAERGRALQEDAACPVYDFDWLQAFLQSGLRETPCEKLLDFWNLFDDAAFSMQKEFLGNQKQYNKLYNKLFYGSNLPAIRREGEEYLPRWSQRERKTIRKILQNGLCLLETARREMEI